MAHTDLDRVMDPHDAHAGAACGYGAPCGLEAAAPAASLPASDGGAPPVSESERAALRSQLASNFQAMAFHREVRRLPSGLLCSCCWRHAAAPAEGATQATPCRVPASPQHAACALYAWRQHAGIKEASHPSPSCNLQGYVSVDLPLEAIDHIALLVEARAHAYVVRCPPPGAPPPAHRLAPC